MGEDHWGRTKRAQRNSWKEGSHQAGRGSALPLGLGALYQRPWSLLEPMLCERYGNELGTGVGVGGARKISNHTDIRSSYAPCCTRTGRQWPKEHSAAPIPATCDARSPHQCKELSALPEVSTIMSPLEGPLPHPQPPISAFPSIQYPVPTQGVSST